MGHWDWLRAEIRRCEEEAGRFHKLISKFIQYHANAVPHPLDDFGLGHLRLWNPDRRTFCEWHLRSLPQRRLLIPQELGRQRLFREQACRALWKASEGSTLDPPTHAGLGHMLWRGRVLIHVLRKAGRPMVRLQNLKDLSPLMTLDVSHPRCRRELGLILRGSATASIDLQPELGQS